MRFTSHLSDILLHDNLINQIIEAMLSGVGVVFYRTSSDTLE